MEENVQPGNAVTIAKFFGLSGRDAMEELKKMDHNEKQILADGIRNGSLTY